MQTSTLLELGPATWILLAVLTVVSAVLWRWGFGRPGRDMIIAAVRALVQLAVVALLIALLSQHVGLSWILILVMFLLATWTAGRRITPQGRWWFAGVAIAVGVVPVGGVMLLTGVLPWNPLALIALFGQQIGGAMAATTVAARRIEQELSVRRGEVEAAAALGFTWPQARILIARPVASEAVIPTLDQTRTAGLVVLPGAFVGLILGGASPLAAGAVQLVVLVSLLLVATLASGVCLILSSRGAWHPPASDQRRTSFGRRQSAHPAEG
ncbi:ABC transporter permease [Psychromicrobium xiongbiense]|uniref:ABC transporter permease n=1 Tax=Psychromicrobium xiongbiense TaxID=3051184 RepID=UPI002556A0EA|nr:ABC transporter permease [Psychromicrobium sp. YIM S02556]